MFVYADDTLYTDISSPASRQIIAAELHISLLDRYINSIKFLLSDFALDIGHCKDNGDLISPDTSIGKFA